MTRKNLSFDEPTRAILQRVGNQSRYISAVVNARDRIWRSAVRALVESGTAPKDIISMCEAAGPNVHTLEDWSRPPRDGDGLNATLERARLACVASEWWCGNELLRHELRSWAEASVSADP